MISTFSSHLREAGCDEAGRGCLAGPVYAAAVILPRDFYHAKLNDSKKLTPPVREELRMIIEENAIACSVASVSEEEIDEINIVKASFLAMHKAINKLKPSPEFLLIDGNRFVPWKDIPFQCIIKGDGKYANIAAASILAKTYRDDYMRELSRLYPQYGWERNKGYATRLHREALFQNGPSPFHRRSFTLNPQLSLFSSRGVKESQIVTD